MDLSVSLILTKDSRKCGLWYLESVGVGYP